MAYAGIDVGTSGCKMLVYDLEGNILYTTSRKYRELNYDGYRELDPEVVINAVDEVLQDLGKNCPVTVDALAVATIGESVVCIDEHGNYLHNSLVTGDKRGIDEVQRLLKQYGAQKILDITGVPPSEMFSLPKLMWLNENTDAIKRASEILFYEDFIAYHLTGKRLVSYSSAARSMAFDIEKKEWNTKLLEAAGISVQQMSTPVESGAIIGEVLPEVSKKLQINPKLIVVSGGHDQSCAALGGGLSDLKVGECGLGTCEFTFMVLPKPVKSPDMIKYDLTCIPYVFPDKYLTSIEVTTCGILKNWGKDTVFRSISEKCDNHGVNFFEYMDKHISDLKTDLLVLPQFGSSGNPDINYEVNGTITGLNTNTKIEEIYLAMLEGMAMQSYLAYEYALPLGVQMEKIILTGGGSNSDVTLQLRADIFNMTTATVSTTEAGTLGCMILAATAMGKYKTLEEGIDKAVHIQKEFKPNLKLHEYYIKKYEKFKKLYRLMHNF